MRRDPERWIGIDEALAMVGTTHILVALCSWMSRNTCDGSNRRTITCLMPSMVEACGWPHPLA